MNKNSEKNEKLLLALGCVDEKYVEEAIGKPKVKMPIALTVAASFALIVTLSLAVVLSHIPSVGGYAASPYAALIKSIENYRSFGGNTIGKIDNVTSNAPSVGGSMGGQGIFEDDYFSPPPTVTTSGSSSNGNYIESTDNQVNGVVEGDLFKTTDKYIFRIDNDFLCVYTIDKENSKKVASFEIPKTGDFYSRTVEMYLSEDCNTITLLKDDLNDVKEYHHNVCILSLDVSDVNNISVKGKISITGALNTSRMVGGMLLLTSRVDFNENRFDYSEPTTFVPSVKCNGKVEPISPEDIFIPDSIDNISYSVVALVDPYNLGIVDTNALIGFRSDIYVSEENIFISREYWDFREDAYDRYFKTAMSEVAVIGYSGDGLENKGTVTFKGNTKDQYSFDERGGYLRVVATNSEISNTYASRSEKNVSLYIFDLKDNSLAYYVENFAIEGEEATAVRFDGDMLYVCTADVSSFSDPVYFFDLSDYGKITSADTGIIAGFSTSLVDLGEGFLLGIGDENRTYSKVEIYEQLDGEVVSVAEYKFVGTYSKEYKAYLVNREENLFGFAITRYITDEETEIRGKELRYILLEFDGEELRVVSDVEFFDGTVHTTRAVFIDGYLYLTTPKNIIVEKVVTETVE